MDGAPTSLEPSCLRLNTAWASCAAQVWYYSVATSPCAALLVFERTCCAKGLIWGAVDSI